MTVSSVDSERLPLWSQLPHRHLPKQDWLAALLNFNAVVATNGVVKIILAHRETKVEPKHGANMYRDRSASPKSGAGQ